MRKILLFVTATVLAVTNLFAREVDKDISYRCPKDKECVLDVSFEAGVSERPVIVWFHGGGLTSGKRSIPAELEQNGYVVIGVDYRLYPSVKVKEIIDDGAAAVAWAYENAAKYGGSAKKIFIAGHSAGGYICAMLGLDKSYLAKYGIDADTLAGLGLYSGQMITHFTERKDRGMSEGQPVVDEMAPLYHVRGDAPPMFVVTGDRNLEMVNRYEENAYFCKMLQYNGHKDVTFYEEGGYNHSRMCAPAHPLFIKWIKNRDK